MSLVPNSTSTELNFPHFVFPWKTAAWHVCHPTFCGDGNICLPHQTHQEDSEVVCYSILWTPAVRRDQVSPDVRPLVSTSLCRGAKFRAPGSHCLHSLLHLQPRAPASSRIWDSPKTPSCPPSQNYILHIDTTWQLMWFWFFTTEICLCMVVITGATKHHLLSEHWFPLLTTFKALGETCC